jgi:hypothetical protein
MSSLPKVVSKDLCFAALWYVALSWHEQSYNVFRIQHRKSFERGAFGCPSDIVNTLIFLLRHFDFQAAAAPTQKTSSMFWMFVSDTFNITDICLNLCKGIASTVG